MKKSMMALAGLLAAVTVSLAEEPVALVQQGKENLGWRFGNGPEFPGGMGKLSIDSSEKNQGQDSLKLEGDFSKGGNYVEAAFDIDDCDIETLNLWVKKPEGDKLTFRFVDASGQCHQLRLKIKESADWQKISFPFNAFFSKMGSEGSDMLSSYEFWGGPKDGKWHPPAKFVAILNGRTAAVESKPHTMWFNDFKIYPKPGPVMLKQTVRLDEFPEGELDWDFSLGQEFPGAQGKLEIAKGASEQGKDALKLSADFTKGGAYVAMQKDLEGVEGNLRRIVLKVKSPNATSLSVQIYDSSYQCHQRKGIQIVPDNQYGKQYYQNNRE